MKQIIWTLITIIALVIASLHISRPENQTNNALLLLGNENPLVVNSWKNIAAEEGLHLSIESNNAFFYSKKLSPENYYKGIILPDGVQQKMSQKFADRLKAYVKNGGYLFLTFDAGTKDPAGQAVKVGSYFSDLLGFNYIINTKSKSYLESGFIGNVKTKLNKLGIPPGKCILQDNQSPDSPSAASFCAISSYSYGPIAYRYFHTEPMNNIDSLLLTTPDHQFIAGVIPFGKGKILLVNLPLTSLWAQTDAMLLHTFLQYFAVDMLHLPTLSPVPNGVGGLVLNLHVEAKSDLAGFDVLQALGLFQQGPYSIDFTAGPDEDTLNDGHGLDVLHNPTTQNWIHYLAKLGNAIGSDGGWAHNYFGLHVNNTNENEFLKYIIMNNNAMESVLGKKVLEYVPPVGNQPSWVKRYLEKKGFLGYYTTSNIGTAPTQNFHSGIFDSPSIWLFPVLPFGKYASIHEFQYFKISAEAIKDWYVDSTNFVASRHTSRLIYFHPHDVSDYKEYIYSLKGWLAKTAELSKVGSFHWYSMVDIARFLNKRRNVTWVVEKKNGSQIFKASHPISLEEQAWLIDKSTCNKPVIDSGLGSLKEDANFWIVVAGDTKNLQFQCESILSSDKSI